MLDIILLGRFEVRQNGERLIVPTRNAQALLAYLLLTAGQAHRRERLASLFWPDSLEESARSNLRHELWRLRKALEPAGPNYLLSDDLSIGFNAQAAYSLDTHALEATAIEAGDSGQLMAALSVYKGELLPEFDQEWVYAERRRLQAAYEARMARLLDMLLAEWRWSEVIEWGGRWIATGEMPEPAYRALMIAHANSGDVTKAVMEYERFSQQLKSELGAQPSSQTQELYRRLLAGWQPPQPTQPTPRPARSTAEAVVPISARTHTTHSNLPRPLTSYIGRETEIDQIQQLASQARLVTITGVGGAGKTRLSIEVARRMAPAFADGAWWVELAPLSEGETARTSDDGPPNISGYLLVVQAMLKVLHVIESPDRRPMESLIEFIRERHLLVVLDNCEHLISGCAGAAEEMLTQAPFVTLLVTSREPLAVPGEKVWPLSSLSLPAMNSAAGTATIAESEAVQLFIERAADVAPGFAPTDSELTTIAQICIRLDGIPLAIELAAARIAMLSADEIAARLDDRFNLLTGGRRTALPRHQTLQAAIEWSYDLLTPPEQRLFRRLTVFAGSLTLDGAEAICADELLPSEEVLTTLGRLVDKSLLQVGSPPYSAGLATRYRMLDTICTFSQLKLEETGELRALRDRHLVYYTSLVEAAEPELFLQDQITWSKMLRAEYDNIRAAIDWSVASDQGEYGLRLVAGLTWFWFSFGSMRDGVECGQRVLSLPSTRQPTLNRARALNTASYLHWFLGQKESMRDSIQEALAILNVSGDPGGMTWALQLQALWLSTEGRHDEANEAMAMGVTIARTVGDHHLSSLALAFWGDIVFLQGDAARAATVYAESAALLRSMGNHNFLAYPLRRLGYLALDHGDLTLAWRYFRESLALNRDVGDRRARVANFNSIAILALRNGRSDVAIQLLGLVEHHMELLSNLLPLDQVALQKLRDELALMLDEATASLFDKGWAMNEDEALELVERTFGQSIVQNGVIAPAG